MIDANNYLLSKNSLDLVQGVSFENWKCQIFFLFSKICLHFSADRLQFFKKIATSQTSGGAARGAGGAIAPPAFRNFVT